MSVADKITRLQNAKEAIATAITTKGGTVSTGDGFEDFADDIGTISSRFGVYLAYKYYFSLFKKIKRSSATKVLNERVRIPDSYKLLLMSRCYLDYKISSFI